MNFQFFFGDLFLVNKGTFTEVMCLSTFDLIVNKNIKEHIALDKRLKIHANDKDERIY